MTDQGLRRGVFTGTFDPITNGHIDLIRRGLKFVDELIVAVGHNPEKKALFTPSERIAMIHELVGDLKNVRVEAYEGLTAEFVQEVGGNIILRGIRDNVDLHFELQQANINMAIGGVETIARYNPATQDLTWRVPGVSGINFGVNVGHPYIACLDDTAPAQWP